jgi:hypothetical protein
MWSSLKSTFKKQGRIEVKFCTSKKVIYFLRRPHSGLELAANKASYEALPNFCRPT